MQLKKSQEFYRCITQLMRNKMEDFIKHIIIEKKYFELTQKERSLINEWVANEDEFDSMKQTFISIDALNIDNENNLSSSVKEKLNERFAAKHAPQNEDYWNKFILFFFPKDTQFFRKPAFHLAVVALVVLLTIPFLWQDESAQYAMQKSEIKIDTFEFDDKLNDEQSSNTDKVKKELNSTELTFKPKEEQIVNDKEEVIGVQEEELTIPIFKGDNFLTGDMVIEETHISKRLDVEIQNSDEILLRADKDQVNEGEKVSAEIIDASETLALLTPLY